MHLSTSKMRNNRKPYYEQLFNETSSKEKEMKLNWKKKSAVFAVTGALLLIVAAVAFSHGHRMQDDP